MVFLGGLLMQGCKREEPSPTASVVLPPLEETNDFPALPPFEPLTNIQDSLGLEGGRTPEVPGIGVNDFPVPLPIREETSQPEIAPEPTPEPRGVVEYKVQRGDYFFSIARKFDITAEDIARANPGVDSTRLQVGQTLKIPAPGSMPPKPPSTETPPAGVELYTVKKGDTLTRIASQYGTTVPALKEMNGLVTDRIIINQKLKVPAPTGGGTPRS
jgi:LysM repeat protein